MKCYVYKIHSNLAVFIGNTPLNDFATAFHLQKI